MRRAAFVTLAAFSLAFTSGALTAQQKKKDPLDEPILGKSIGAWIKILRTDKEVRHRRAALIALEAGDAAGKSGLPALLSAIEKDKEPVVRQEAVALLGRLPKAPGAMKALVAALQTDPSGDVREAAAAAIGSTNFIKQAPDYISALTDGLKDSHLGTRIAVAVTLRDLGKSAKPAFPALFDAAKNPKENQQVRAAALHVLSRHDGDDAQTVRLLLDLLKTADTPATLREAAIDGLGYCGGESEDAVAALCRTLTDKNTDLRKASAVSLVALGAKAKSGWPTIKVRVGYANQKIDAPPNEPDSSIRNHLIRLTGALAKANPEAIKSLTAMAIRDTSTENRIAAIQELGELPTLPQETRDELRRIAREGARQAIREAAAKALKK